MIGYFRKSHPKKYVFDPKLTVELISLYEYSIRPEVIRIVGESVMFFNFGLFDRHQNIRDH